jgi:hypothetical protein
MALFPGQVPARMPTLYQLTRTDIGNRYSWSQLTRVPIPENDTAIWIYQRHLGYTLVNVSAKRNRQLNTPNLFLCWKNANTMDFHYLTLLKTHLHRADS